MVIVMSDVWKTLIRKLQTESYPQKNMEISYAPEQLCNAHGKYYIGDVIITEKTVGSWLSEVFDVI